MIKRASKANRYTVVTAIFIVIAAIFGVFFIGEYFFPDQLIAANGWVEIENITTSNDQLEIEFEGAWPDDIDYYVFKISDGTNNDDVKFYYKNLNYSNPTNYIDDSGSLNLNITYYDVRGVFLSESSDVNYSEQVPCIFRLWQDRLWLVYRRGCNQVYSSLPDTHIHCVRYVQTTPESDHLLYSINILPIPPSILHPV